MGILDSIRGKVDELDKTYNPMRKAADALDTAGKQVAGTLTGKPATPATPTPSAEAKTPQQAAYEAKEKYMNRNNPGYVPRAKGGPVKAGGHPMKMKNVDNSGLKKEPC